MLISFDMVFYNAQAGSVSDLHGFATDGFKPFVQLMRAASCTNFALGIVKPDIYSVHQQLKAGKRLTSVIVKRAGPRAVTFDIESSYLVDIASTGAAMSKLLEITGGRAAPIEKIKIVYTYDSRSVEIDVKR